MTVNHNSIGSIIISNLTINLIPEPTMSDPSAYTGHFHSDNENLNCVWYAGAYTNQLCVVALNQGVTELATNWYDSISIGSGT